MSDRIQKSWKVIRSIESADGTHCVDFFVRQEDSYGFEEFRRDIDDMGKWTGVAYHSISKFDNLELAVAEAITRIPWLE